MGQVTADRELMAGLADVLATAGSDLVFGVPGGGANLELIGAFQDAGMRFVLVHTESAGAIMAASYAELTQVPGVCLATRGPGAASMVNGVAHAWLDRCPMLAISDVVPADQRRRVTHQLVDQRELIRAVAKASCTLGRGGDGAAEAVRFAQAPPWGPVHVDADASSFSDTRELAPATRSPLDRDALRRARKLLAAAKRPVLAAGVGSRGAEPAVREFATTHGVPVLATYKAKGCVDERSDLWAGLITGATMEAPILAKADCVLAVGLDPVELIPAPWPYPATIVAIGPWTSDGQYFLPDVCLEGDLVELLDALRGTFSGGDWHDMVASHRRAATDALLAAQARGDGIGPIEVVREARRAFCHDNVATVDAGAHMLAAMEFWTVHQPRQALISSGLATMGFALPAAIAAALAHPQSPIVCFVGEGGLGMCLGELETVARLALDITIVVLNDARLSLIELKQRAQGNGGESAVRFADVDFAAVARAHGIASHRVSDPSTLAETMKVAANTPGPFLVDAAIDCSGYRALIDAIRGGDRAVVGHVELSR